MPNNHPLLTLTALLSLALAPLAQAGNYSGGTGQPTNPYQLATPQDWLELTNTPTDWSANFILTNDIDFLETGPIRPVADAYWVYQQWDGTPFTGTLDGRGHSLRYATIVPGDQSAALFGGLAPAARVSNLHLHQVHANGVAAAALTSSNLGTITNCSATGMVIGYGGLVGNNDGAIDLCWTDVDVRGPGGLVGYNYGPISRSAARGPVRADEAGGLVGRNSGSITECFATGPVTALSGGNRMAGGLVAWNTGGEIADSIATGRVHSETPDAKIGGLVGVNHSFIRRSYALGPVTNRTYAGGLVGGFLFGSAINSFWDVETTGRSQSAGGTPATTEQLHSLDTFSSADWDFENNWIICDGMNYPRLQWQTHPADLTCPFGLDLADFTRFAAAWHTTPADPAYDIACDTTDDGSIDIVDLAALAQAWLDDLTLLQSTSATSYSGGDGTETNPYRIATPEDWIHLTKTRDDWSKHFLLTADLDFQNRAVEPVGSYFAYFRGHLDGAGHTITDLRIVGPQLNFSQPGNVPAGLFAIIDAQAEIKNLSVTGAYVIGEGYAGGLAGTNAGNIHDCRFSGTILGVVHLGGLVGYNNAGQIESSSADATLARHPFNVYAPNHVGGLVGYNRNGTISNSHAHGPVSAEANAGGLVGNAEQGAITMCYATGAVSADERVGGLVGVSSSDISSCYATGHVTGQTRVGGLIGKNTYQVSKCYSIGQVAGDSLVGGLIGENTYNLPYISFWDTQTSTIPDPQAGQPDTDNIIGKSTPEMTTQTTFTDANWNFDTIWTITPPQTYPQFQWQLAPGE